MPKTHKLLIALVICLGFYPGSTLASGQPTTQTDRVIPHIKAPSAPIKAKPATKPTITRKSSDTATAPSTAVNAFECWAPFRWIDPNCYNPGDYYEGSQQATHTVEVERTVTRSTQICFPDNKYGRKAAKHFERKVNSKHGQRYAQKKGYDSVTGKRTDDGLHVDLTFAKTMTVRMTVKGEGNGRSSTPGGVHDGDTGRERDEQGPESNY